MDFFEPTNIHPYIAIFLSILNGGLLCFTSSKFLQIIQQSGYHIKGYNTWLRGTRYKYISRLISLGLLSVACALVTNALFDVYHSEAIYSYFGLIFYIYFSAVFIVNLVKEPNKTPLVKTKRITRNLSALFIFYSAITFVLISLSTEYIPLLRFAVITITPIFVPFAVVVVFCMLYPIEAIINSVYIANAKNKLKKYKNLIKIGITGSYAKTTNKFILTKMLSKKYKTLCSPQSYNTPLGLTRVILGELNNDYEVFVAEMGAKKKGEINQLCKLVNPDHAIITGIGSQHLESFKTQQNITNTKFELAQHVDKKSGIVVYNGANQLCVSLYEKSQNPNKIVTEKNNKYCFAEIIKIDNKGLKFKLNIDGKSQVCTTNLLGQHNLQNICMCATLAYKLGVSLENIATAVSELEPVQHRMQMINSGTNLIIDDSFNASVEGCRAAFATLALFKNNTKVIITPGIVEMGKYETQVNVELGEEMAKVCDYCIIVNEINKNAIVQGLEKQNFDQDKIICVETLNDATEALTNLALSDAVILFENDLPDIFNY